ncbi:Predicted bile acid beta-glucosidase [uncultured Ruminococcus sp.]|nr:Predicted bile acid beta-glucosidase [uncultured Clostridium sp.]SCI34302.1 Predicted bile acid beta-glucosidase [uncultured Ruminococcus sp.]
MSNMYSNKWYDDKAVEAKFLLGGIGTGNFSVGIRGQLCDWELWEDEAVGRRIPYTFFALRTEQEDGSVKVKVMESKKKPPYERSHGFDPWDNLGIPRFEHSRMCGEVSQVVVELTDSAMPVDVTMTGFTPFIPLNEDDSGIPAAILRYRVHNKTGQTVKTSVVGSLANVVGFAGYKRFADPKIEGEAWNEQRQKEGYQGIYMSNHFAEDDLRFGSMSLVTTSKEHVTVKPEWLIGGWWDGAHDFWAEFEETGQMHPGSSEPESTSAIAEAREWKIGSLCADFELKAGEEKEIEFVISWYFPNRRAYWPGHMFPKPEKEKTVRHYYSTLFSDAWDVSEKLLKKLPLLEKQSEQFRKALYETTIPAEMLDAMAANLTVLRSHTCFRLEDGSFLGWEGCFDDAGCCEGNCTHVWNYQQALAFLFPNLERNMRWNNFLLETDEEGRMYYRGNRIFGFDYYDAIPPAADGQTGTIVQLYRDWKLSGDDEFLKQMWPKASLALDYAFTCWDTDGDFVFDGEQHNTYDIEFYGMTSMTNSVFYAALKAAEEMAAYLNDEAHEKKYREARLKGSERMDRMLYNGEYYIQKNDQKGKYQYYDGCLSDQVFGQELAHICGLGYILPQEHVKSAVYSVYKYNFREKMGEHINVQRCYAMDDESGLILCTWPHSKKPRIPFVYSDEVWTGIEYQVAAHLIYEGYFEEALKIVSAVRSRYDGVRRNPWNEVECGNHYVRSMASWGLLIAASGYGFDLTKGKVSFAPKISQDHFSCFFSTGKHWGVYRQTIDPETNQLESRIEVLYGDQNDLELQQ